MDRPLGLKAAGAIAVLALAGVAALGALRVGGSEAVPRVVVETLVGIGGEVSLHVEAEGLDPGAEYLVRLNSADAAVSASSGQLGRVFADEDGRFELSATTAVIGVGAEVPLTTELFTDGGRLVTVMAVSGDEAGSAHVEFRASE